MKLFLTTIFGLFVFVVSAQTVRLESGSKVVRIETVKFNADYSNSLQINVPMDFNTASNFTPFEKVKPEDIESISLIYTRYKLTESFSQLDLNMQRTNTLYSKIPHLRNNKTIKWYWVEQTGCEDAGTCKGFYHGFVIQIKDKKAIEKTKEESELLNYYIKALEGKESDSKYMDSLIATGKSHFVKVCTKKVEYIKRPGTRIGRIVPKHGMANVELAKLIKKQTKNSTFSGTIIINEKLKLLEADNKELFLNQPKIAKFISENYRFYSSKFQWKKLKSKVNITIAGESQKSDVVLTIFPILEDTSIKSRKQFLFLDSVHEFCEYIDTSKKATFYGYSINEKVVNKVLERHEEWEDAVIATDVTGSMYPYIAQFMHWHKLNIAKSSKIQQYVFFNDGDNMMDNLKIVGKVGGIYSIATNNYDSLYAVASLAMRMGGGGDGPENNLEASIYALKKFKNCKSVVMIADNWATPRDLSLINKIHVPIHIILCGTINGAVNAEYLNLARKTGGSVHTVEQDIEHLEKLLEGETIEINKLKYKLSGGKFVAIN